MKINRNNYEEFFLLYMDNELSAADRLEVEEFLLRNPDLGEELEILMQTQLTPNEPVIFEDKEILYKDTEIASPVNLNNYKEYFLSYIDNELGTDQRNQVHHFLQHHSELQAELDLLFRSKLDPEDHIVFADKGSLYREEAPAPVVLITWRRIAVAASVILLAGLFWIYSGNNKNSSKGQLATTNQPVPKKLSETPRRSANPTEQSSNVNQGSNQNPEVAETGSSINSKRSKVESSTEKSNELGKKQSNLPGENTIEQIKEQVAINQTEKAENVQVDPSKIIEPSQKLVAKVEPNIIDKPAEIPEENKLVNEAVYTNDKGVTYLDTDNSDKKDKGKFRGFFRKAARFVDRVTNPDLDDKKSIVRVANFEIGTNK